MKNISVYFEQILAGKNLSAQDMQDILTACMQGEVSDAQIAAFLVMLRMKGETAEELTAAARVMMAMAHTVDLGKELIDIVGTGGDGKNTFNVSTASSIVAAAAGARVAKHGSTSVSSSSGSSEVLTQAGISLQLSDEQLQTCMQNYNFCFLFAPHFHLAMQKVRNARQQLHIRSFFNILGPLINPARVTRQVIGVFNSQWQQPLAEVLANLGSERALVVCSRDGLDEISIAAVTDVLEYNQKTFTSWVIDPKEYGLMHENLDAIIVDSPAKSLQLIMSVFQGETGPARDIVLLNTAAALYCADLAGNLHEAIQKAAVAIDSGKALRLFEQLREFTSSEKM